MANTGHGDEGTRRWGDQSPTSDVDKDFYREMHRVIPRVTDDLEKFKFNTAVAALMGYLNFLYDRREAEISRVVWRQALETLTQLLCPIAPFVTEEVWQEALGHQGSSVHQAPWPEVDKMWLSTENVTVMIQVNGKLRDKVTVPAEIEKEDLKKKVLARKKVQKYVDDKPVRKTIIVPQRLINIVVN